MTNVHICRFSAGLDELTRKQQKDPKIVLETLKSMGRFSSFEASENRVIAKTVDLIFDRKLVKNEGGAYPWTKVSITPAGEQYLVDGIMPEPEDELKDFVRIDKRNYVHKSIAEAKGLKEYRG